MEWVVDVTTCPLYPRERDPKHILLEAVCAPDLFWMRAENIAPTGIRSPDRADRSESLYGLSYSTLLVQNIFKLDITASSIRCRFASLQCSQAWGVRFLGYDAA